MDDKDKDEINLADGEMPEGEGAEGATNGEPQPDTGDPERPEDKQRN